MPPRRFFGTDPLLLASAAGSGGRDVGDDDKALLG